jgi:hypothetical protein
MRNLLADTAMGQCTSLAILSLQAAASTQIVAPTFDSTAFGAASSGIATANAITDGVASTAGTVTIGQILSSTGTLEVLSCSVTSTGGGGDIELSSNVISSGQTVSITSLTYTAPS